MPAPELELNASPLAIHNIRAVISAYHDAVTPGESLASPSELADQCSELHATFLKAFAGLFQKRVSVYQERRGYYTLSASPGSFGKPLAGWISRLPVLMPEEGSSVSPTDKTCLIHRSEVESLISHTETYIEQHYGSHNAQPD